MERIIIIGQRYKNYNIGEVSVGLELKGVEYKRRDRECVCVVIIIKKNTIKQS